MEAAELTMYAIWFTGVMMIQVMATFFLVLLLRKKQCWSLMMFALRGGSLILKGHPDNTIELEHTTQPISEIKWKIRDKMTGKRMELVQPLKQVFHTLKGTSWPIHICPISFPTSINILTKEKAHLNIKEINSLMAKQYTQGAADATSFKTFAGFPIDKATLIMLFVVGIMVVILIAVNLQVLDVVTPVA